MMLNLLLPGASIDLKTRAAAKKKSSKQGACMEETQVCVPHKEMEMG